MDKIYFLSGPLLGATAELIGEEITLGRASTTPFASATNPVRSSRSSHPPGQRLGREGPRSAKGTFVRGERVLVAALRDGDKLASVCGSGVSSRRGHAPTADHALTPAEPQVITWPATPGGGAKRRLRRSSPPR